MTKDIQEKNKGGRPPYEFTDVERKQVEALAGYGVPQHQIASLIRDGIAVHTLIDHFRRELDTGLAKANAQVGKTLFQKAIGGDTASMIWWSKAQMRWAETMRQEHSGSVKTIVEYVDPTKE